MFIAAVSQSSQQNVTLSNGAKSPVTAVNDEIEYGTTMATANSNCLGNERDPWLPIKAVTRIRHRYPAGRNHSTRECWALSSRTLP